MTPDCHFDSLQDLSAHVATSKDNAVTWHQYETYNNTLAAGRKDFAGRMLDDILPQCHALTDPVLQARCAAIEALTTDLVARLPQATRLRREATWNRQGSRLALGRVLQGHTKPWRRLVRQEAPGGNPLYLVVLPVAVGAARSEAEIVWNTSATLALVDVLQHQQARVELWSVWGSTDVYPTQSHYTITTCLLRSSQAWNLHDTVLTTDKAYNRRLHFRLLEMGQVQHGPLHGFYGLPYSVPEMETFLTSWAPTVSPSARPLLGAHQHDGIHDAASARRWLTMQLENLKEPTS